MSFRPANPNQKDVKMSKTIKDFNSSPLQSSKSLPKLNKKISKRMEEIEIGEVYITDKLKMAEETLMRMEKSKLLWGELIRFFDKMHTGLKLIAASSQSTDETILTLSKLHVGDLGDTLKDMATTRARISQQYQVCSSTIFDSFVLDVAHSMDPHLKRLAFKTKEVHTDGVALKNQMAVAEKNISKFQKNGASQQALQEQMKKFNAIKAENDKGKAKILSSVLLFEKERLSFLVNALNKVVQQELLLSERFLSQKERLENWKTFVSNKALSSAHMEALSTTRTLRDIKRRESMGLNKNNVQNALKQQQQELSPSSPRGRTESTFGEKNSPSKPNIAMTRTNTQLVLEQQKPEVLEASDLEVIATCEEILADMKQIALSIEELLLNLDGLTGDYFIEEINKIIDSEEMKKAENLIWEYEDYMTDYPEVFSLKKFWSKKQFFKKNIGVVKNKLNVLLEEELQQIQDDYTNNYDY